MTTKDNDVSNTNKKCGSTYDDDNYGPVATHHVCTLEIDHDERCTDGVARWGVPRCDKVSPDGLRCETRGNHYGRHHNGDSVWPLDECRDCRFLATVGACAVSSSGGKALPQDKWCWLFTPLVAPHSIPVE